MCSYRLSQGADEDAGTAGSARSMHAVHQPSGAEQATPFVQPGCDVS